MVLILVGLVALSGGTFLYQRWRKQQNDEDAKNNPQKDVEIAGGDQPVL